VTALFPASARLPIPHTAIVATRKERIGQILGNFVQNHFLSREVIATNLPGSIQPSAPPNGSPTGSTRDRSPASLPVAW